MEITFDRVSKKFGKMQYVFDYIEYIENETFNFMVCDFPVRKLIEIHF